MGHRDDLLAAARRLLERQGYARTTARDLVAESGTNLASIGYHFGSKEALLNAAIESAFGEWTEHLAKVAMANPDATPIERGLTTWMAVLESMPEHRPLLQAYVDAVAQAQRTPQLRAQLATHYQHARHRVAELVAKTLGEGTAADDPRCTAIASFVIAVCDGLSLQWLLDPEHTPDPTALAAGLATVWEASATNPRR